MPEVKTSRIDEILNEKPWDGKHGRVWYYTLVLQNGDRGEIGTKTRDFYKMGDELVYTAENTDHGWKLKKFNPDQQQNNYQGGSQGNSQPQQQGQQTPRGARGSSASFALSYAKDLAVANVAANGQPIDMEMLADKVIAAAEKFNSWLEGGNG